MVVTRQNHSTVNEEPTSSHRRRRYTPLRSESVLLPKSRCSPRKFLHLIRSLSEEKKDAIATYGFGGLLRLSCMELRYELCAWLISAFDVAYHRIRMVDGQHVTITAADVSMVLGIPCHGVEVVVHNRGSSSTRTYSTRSLEERLISLPIGDEFKKTFFIFACATILAPNSKPEGMHDLWDTIVDGDITVPRNWAQFVLQFLRDGIKEYKSKQGPSYIRGCLLFLQLFYMSRFSLPTVTPVLTRPFGAAWSDALIKRRLAAEVDLFGAYGHIQVCQDWGVVHHNEPNDVPPSDSVSGEEPIESNQAIQERLLRSASEARDLASQSRDLASRSSKLMATIAKDVDTLMSRGFGGHAHHREPNPPSPSADNEPAVKDDDIPAEPVVQPHVGHSPVAHTAQDASPSTIQQCSMGVVPMTQPSTQNRRVRRYKQLPRRDVKPGPACKSPFVAECISTFPRIPYPYRVVADYAFDDGGDPK